MSVNVLFDTSPLTSGHSIRGIGRYTRELEKQLQTSPEVKLHPNSQSLTKASKPKLIHYPFFDLFWPTLPILKQFPTVVTIHDVIPLQFPKNYRIGLRGKLALLHQKHSLKSVKAVITDSHASAAHIHTILQVPIKKIFVVYLAAQRAFETSSVYMQTKIRRKCMLPVHFVLYVGDINYNKNLPQLIKALKYLDKELHLVCVGQNFQPKPIPEWLAIEQQIAMSDVSNRVHFVTDLKSNDTEALAALYSAAQAYVQPSLSEGFGLPILEAMQCGTPVVAAMSGSLPEVGGVEATYCSTDAESIADAIKEVTCWSSAKKLKYQLDAKRWAAQFSWERTASETIQVYKNLT